MDIADDWYPGVRRRLGERLIFWQLFALDEHRRRLQRAVPALFLWFDAWHGDVEVRRSALDELTRVPVDAVFAGLVDRLHLADVPAAVLAAADQFPEHAARVLTERRTEPFVSTVLAWHLARHPELAAAGVAPLPRRPVAQESSVPALLAAPPWKRPKPPRIAVPWTEVPASIHWLAGERELWSWDPWPPVADDYWTPADRSVPSVPFALRGPEREVRPLLADWRTEDARFYMQNPRVLVARFELDALAPVLRLARRKPLIGASLLLPYRSAEVAHLMATWLAGSRQFRPVAQEWFARHGSAGVAPLLPTALGAPPARSRPVALALTRIDPDVVLAAAAEVGCTEAAEAFLSRDPLDLVPSRVPTLPEWLGPWLLPQVLLRGGTHALPDSSLEVLCRMTAMSSLDQPYEGLRLVAEECDPRSLAEFAWSVFETWHVVGRPAKDVWALDALAYFGDGSVADRLAPMVRRWPSEGAATRAKRGVDVLAAMHTDGALQHVGVIARAARSGPLRAHATAALDRIALDRGLLPEQLDDLLAPDLGLGEVLSFRGTEYRVELGNQAELVLRAADGGVVALPKPASDEEKTVVAEWKKRRKQAKAAVADQVRRLEEAMILQRAWAAGEFRTAVLAHPLLGRLARRLVWCADGRTATVDRLGDLVDTDGGLLPEFTEVRLAHPRTSDLTAWRRWREERGITQPFVQIDRETFDEDPSAFWLRTVPAAALYGLLARGWQWAPAGQGALRDRIVRPLGAAGSAVLAFEPGLSAVQSPTGQPDQTVESLTLQSPRHGDLALFADLPKVTRSELVRDLRRLAGQAPSRTP